MDPEVARRLVSEEGTRALSAAADQKDPASLVAATALRKEFDPELAAAALAQEALRRRAGTKFGPTARELYFTSAGLEQATRPEVARWRAERLVATGVAKVLDLGCGLGTDALAMVAAGLDVLAVERDETTAVLAAANLRTSLALEAAAVVHPGPANLRTSLVAEGKGQAAVRHADATTIDPGDRTVFCDPARRTGAGRTWNVADFSPSWDFVTGLLDRAEGACLKLGPGLPHRLIPERTRTEWISHQGDLVEATVWSARFGGPGRAAVLLRGAESLHQLEIDPAAPPATVSNPDRYVHEPNPAVLAAGGLPTLAAETGARRIHPDIAYLTTSTPAPSPFWTSFEVLEHFPWREKDLRRWTTEHRIGTLEIKKRGIEIDPATLRRRLRLKGSEQATIIITPTANSAHVLVVRRLAPHSEA